MVKSNTRSLDNYLIKNQIADPNETFSDVITRVVDSVNKVGKKYNINSQDTNKFSQRLKNRVFEKQFIPSTPILTNAGRNKEKSLTACSVPDISLNGDLRNVKNIINKFHQEGMGTGFNFSECEDPIEILTYLNHIAINGQKSGLEERPVGNMGVLSVYHPKIIEFLNIKRESYLGNDDWKFNLSIDIDEAFFKALKNREKIKLSNRKSMSPTHLLNLISKAAWECADPGIIFLDRLNKDNPVPQLGEYNSVATCGEVGLIKGGICQFSYINVNSFVSKGSINYNGLENCVNDVIRYLDNALEISISNLSEESSVKVMKSKRKIGIGICGFADALINLEIPYGSEKSLEVIKDLMSFINYTSKKSSVELAKQRGPFLAFSDAGTKFNQDHILKKFGSLDSNSVSKQDWEKLNSDIKKYGIRHVSTTALPPTGRSAPIISASQGIEPHFMLKLNNYLRNQLKRRLIDQKYSENSANKIISEENIDRNLLPYNLKKIYTTCLHVDYLTQLKVISQFQKYIDESVSKTINLPSHITPNEIFNIYQISHELGLKGITIYRDGSKKNQPKEIK